MKRIRCPKCDEAIQFDETQYEPGCVLVFGCPACSKKFRLRIPDKTTPANREDADTPAVYGHLVVLENAFHFKQYIPLVAGENVVGRLVKGTKANAPIKTVDPSIDTTHCVIQVKPRPDGSARFILRDGPSNTGTFLQNEILADRDRVEVHDGDIITLGATTAILREGPEADEE